MHTGYLYSDPSRHRPQLQGLLNIHILLLTVQNQDDHEHKLIFHPLYKKTGFFVRILYDTN